MSDGTLFLALVSLSAAKFAALEICRRQKLKKFEKIGILKSIFQYPLKSASWISLKSSKCTAAGLFQDNISDRTWMVIRKDGALLVARQDPRLVLVKPSSKGDNLCLDAPGMETLLLPKFPEINDQSMFIKCRVWDEYITGLSCGEEANAWIRKYLGNEELGLVVSTSSMEKRDMCLVKKPYVNPAKEGDISAFQDWGGYMVLSEASLDDLNTRLKKKVTMEHFRPNISIAGCTAYDEENWSEMRIGDKVYMRLLDSCERCLSTTIDPWKGERDPEGQPLKTLKSYRYIKEYDIICFGVGAALDVEGEIKVGDPVYVLRKQ